MLINKQYVLSSIAFLDSINNLTLHFIYANKIFKE